MVGLGRVDIGSLKFEVQSWVIDLLEGEELVRMGWNGLIAATSMILSRIELRHKGVSKFSGDHSFSPQTAPNFKL